MRLSLRPGPAPEELGAIRILEFLRDFPEMTPVLEGLGVDPAASAEKKLSQALALEAKALEALLTGLRWRGGD